MGSGREEEEKAKSVADHHTAANWAAKKMAERAGEENWSVDGEGEGKSRGRGTRRCRDSGTESRSWSRVGAPVPFGAVVLWLGSADKPTRERPGGLFFFASPPWLALLLTVTGERLRGVCRSSMSELKNLVDYLEAQVT